MIYVSVALFVWSLGIWTMWLITKRAREKFARECIAELIDGIRRGRYDVGSTEIHRPQDER